MHVEVHGPRTYFLTGNREPYAMQNLTCSCAKPNASVPIRTVLEVDSRWFPRFMRDAFTTSSVLHRLSAPYPNVASPEASQECTFPVSSAFGIPFAFYEDGKTSSAPPLSKRWTMRTTTKPLQALTVGDLMNPDVVRLPEEMALRDAARLLLRNQIGGAPVVDAQGRCVGVFSAMDVLRLSERRADATRPTSPPLPITCSFQAKDRTSDGKEVTRCTLPPGVCPIHGEQEGPGGEKWTVCSQPHCVLVDGQVVDVEKLPTDAVSRFMTPDPVTTRPATSIRPLARMMIDAHIHRVIVVDEERRPIGVVSSTDLLAAVAYSGTEP